MNRTLMTLAAVVAMGTASCAVAQEKSSFDTATRAPYNDAPEKSINGKSIAEMKDKVKAMWDEIVFEKDGKAVEYTVVLDTEAGPIELAFFPQDAPNHARSFIALAKVGYFDDTIFHRCIPGFVIQGGCSKGNGEGGPGYCLKPEFNNRTHKKGILSMARAMPTDSAGSQFFICTGEPTFLDGKYTVFGEVTKGYDAVEKIVSAETQPGDRPVKPVKVKKVTVTEKTAE